MRGVLLGLLMLAVPLHARSLKDAVNPYKSKSRPQGGQKVQNIARVWSALGNQGTYGDANSVLPTYDWPGGTGVYYQWEGRLWLGAQIDDEMYVSSPGEFAPSDGSDWVIKKPGVSMFDVECEYDDWDDVLNGGRELGVKICQRAMQWSVEGFDDFIAYEYKVVYDAAESFHGKDTLEFYMSWIFDADVGGRISTDCHLDDLVGYDGDTRGEWPTNWYPPDRSVVDYPYDKVTLNPDGTVEEEPDSILDQFCVFGDEQDEKSVYEDTLRFWRNFSYIYDGDNATKPGDDQEEMGRAPGYICGLVAYAPPSPSDSVWTGSHGEPCRLTRIFSHQWWNWSNDPGTDEDKLLYMTGKHPFSKGKKFMMHPFIGGAPVFDYRFMHTGGTYKIADGDTLEFVFVGFMGFGLDGGYGYGNGASEGIFQEGKWYPGARWVADQAIKAYYMGSESDPFHPSAPSEETHWLIPIPPEVPYLVYSAARGKVNLAWTDIAEQTPDPIDGEYDFRGYRVYRCEFKIGNWKLVGGYVDAGFAASQPDSCFPDSMYDMISDGVYPHTYVDTTAIYGVPYFYAVTAFDAGRTSPKVRSLASGKVNYKKNDMGAEIPTYVKTERRNSLKDVVVAPNPYIGSGNWEVKYENKVQFMNLPGSCRILIYTVSGDLVRELIHRDGTGDEYWDLLSRNEQGVVSGLYVYKIEAEDEDGKMLRKLGKLVIIK